MFVTRLALLMLSPFRAPHRLFFASTIVSFMMLIACPSVLGRYLILLDKFLADFSPQEVEALTMPTLEEVRATMDASGTQWVQQALTANPSKCCQVMMNHVYYR